MRDCIMQKNNISNQTWSGLYFQLIWFILSIDPVYTFNYANLPAWQFICVFQFGGLDGDPECWKRLVRDFSYCWAVLSFASHLVDLCSTLITLFTTQSARFISKNGNPSINSTPWNMGVGYWWHPPSARAVGYIATGDGPKGLKTTHLAQYQLGTVLVWMNLGSSIVNMQLSHLFDRVSTQCPSTAQLFTLWRCCSKCLIPVC